MSSRARTALPLALAALLGVAGVSACDREKRDFQTIPPGASDETLVRTSALHAGPPVPEPTAGTYQDNAWAIGEGQRLYTQMNCAGCHSPGGGGGIGPALTDDKWIYGAEPEQIYSTIVEGRPDGMPAFGGRIPSQQVWQLVSYIDSLGGQVPQDAAPSRNDDMSVSKPENRIEYARPHQTGHR